MRTSVTAPYLANLPDLTHRTRDIVQPAGGLMLHLIENRELHTAADPRALCGRKTTGQTRVWFALNGCSRCCKAALEAGLEVVVGVDGELVKVQDVLDGVVRD